MNQTNRTLTGGHVTLRDNTWTPRATLIFVRSAMGVR